MRALLLATTGILLASPRLLAQGGPPMITDDPGTPGNGHWEINLAWTDQRTPGETLIALPLLDANYGVGERIQINYETSWNLLRGAEGPAQSGLGDSQVAVKWRFLDDGERGFQASVYPRVIFADPWTDSDRKGLADPHTSFLLPLEVSRDFGILAVNLEIGSSLSSVSSERGWIGGLCLGREVVQGWELDAEIHWVGDAHAAQGETTLNLGTRIDLSKDTTLLLAVGRDAHDTLSPAASLVTYIGLQVRL